MNNIGIRNKLSVILSAAVLPVRSKQHYTKKQRHVQLTRRGRCGHHRMTLIGPQKKGPPGGWGDDVLRCVKQKFLIVDR